MSLRLPDGEPTSPAIPCLPPRTAGAGRTRIVRAALAGQPTPRAVTIRAMNAWHTGPNGGRCPRADGPECSRYGVDAVLRYGAVAGVIMAARYVAACSVFKENPGDPQLPQPCKADAGAVNFAAVGSPCADPSRPQDGQWLAIVGVLAMFARLTFLEAPDSVGPGRNCSNERNR